MDQQQEIEISFEGCLPADATRLAQGLEDQLREAAPTIQANLKRERADSQDFGTTLVLVFGTPVAVALAKGVSNFLQRNAGVSIRITKSGEVVARNLDSGDAARIAEAFATQRAR